MKSKKLRYKKTDGSFSAETISETDVSFSNGSILIKNSFNGSHCSKIRCTALCRDSQRVCEGWSNWWVSLSKNGVIHSYSNLRFALWEKKSKYCGLCLQFF